MEWAQQWKMDALSINTHPPTDTRTYSLPSASLVEGKSAGKDLRSVDDGYLSYSDALSAQTAWREDVGDAEREPQVSPALLG